MRSRNGIAALQFSFYEKKIVSEQSPKVYKCKYFN